MMKRKVQGGLRGERLPFMGPPAFGGVQLTPLDLGRPSGSPLVGYQTRQDGQQADLWDQLDSGYMASEYGDAGEIIERER